MKDNAYELLDEVQDNLKFLAISGVRAKIMITLHGGPKNLSELRELIDLRSSTILHGMNELEKRNIVKKTGDRYNLTPSGKILTLNFKDLVKSVIVTKRFEKLWDGHCIEGIPDNLLLQIGSLMNGDLIQSEPTDIYKPHMTFTQLLPHVNKFRGVSPLFHSDFKDLMIQMVLNGVDTQLIVTESIMNKLYELAAQEPETFTNLTSQENFELWITDEDVKIGFTVTDQFVSLGLAFEDGSYDYSMDLVSDDLDAILWGEKLFKYYREKSKKLFDGFLSFSEKILSFLVFNSLFISLVCVFLTYCSFEFLNVQPNSILLIAVFLSTFSVYSLNRLTDLEEDSVNIPERGAYVKGKEKILLFLCILSYAVALLIGVIVNPVIILVFLFPLIIGVLYSIEVSPKLPRLKNIPGMKNFIVTLSWVVGAVFVPLTCNYQGFGPTVMIFIFIFIKIFVNAVSFDIRDIEGDKKSGVKTIPVLLGRSRTKLLLLGIQSMLIPWFLIAILEGFFLHYWLIFAFSIFYGFWYISYFSENRKLEAFSRDLFVDGEWILIAALCFMVNLHF